MLNLLNCKYQRIIPNYRNCNKVLPDINILTHASPCHHDWSKVLIMSAHDEWPTYSWTDRKWRKQGQAREPACDLC
jgi:hypothetical protein